MGAYAGKSADSIKATAALLRHFRAFVRSDCDLMRDPYSDWGHTLDKRQAQQKITRLVDVAINRKAGVDVTGPACPEGCPGCFGKLRQAQNLINSRAVIDWLPPCLAGRFAHRLRANMDLD